MQKTFKWISVLGCVLGGVAFIGCSEAVDEVTSTVDCQKVCKHYADCFDSDWDVDGCRDRCEDRADSSEAHETQLEQCENCMDDLSCTESFTCADECAGVIP